MRSALTLLMLAVMAGPVAAETYKWVDEKGVTHYSNAPPPSAGKAKQLRQVEDRLSVYQTDPAYEQYLRTRAAQITAAQEAEWIQRQRYLAVAQASYPPDYRGSSYPDYYSGYAYPGYLPAYVVGTRNRPKVMHHTGSSLVHVSHHGSSHGGRR